MGLINLLLCLTPAIIFCAALPLSDTSAVPKAKRTPAYAAATVTSPAGLAWYSADQSTGSITIKSNYQCFHGDASQYPTFDQWLAFQTLWSTNEGTITSSNNGVQQTVQYIHDAILQVSQESSVDARLILAIVMQESTGQASVKCTGTAPDLNCGIMQGPWGSSSFDPSNAQSSILQMIREGVQGTSSEPGLAQYMGSSLTWINNPEPGNPYYAVRGYNTGAISADLDEAKWGTPSYANDVANRLLGWTDVGSDPFDSSC